MQNIIGVRVREARKIHALTQEQLAMYLQLKGYPHTRNTIAKIETGIRQVTDIEVKALAEVLQVSIGWLFDADT